MQEMGMEGPPRSMSPQEALALAESFRLQGRLLEAAALCRQVLQAQPDLAEAEHVLGLVAHQEGKLGQAIEHVQRAASLAPKVALFEANLGEMLRLAGRQQQAVAAARRAIAIDPKLAPAWSNLGVALYELRDYEGAANAQRKAIACKADFGAAHSNLGNALHALRRHDEAVSSYRRALALDPGSADTWANLGTTLHHGGEFEEARIALRRALALAPHHPNAHSGLGILLLMRGDFAEGWEEYEWRLRSSERTGPRFPERPWQGESLAGRHIYVQGEQGFGDTLQFVRYLPLLAARAGAGGGVSLRVQQPLVTLLRESLPGINVLGDRGEVASYHCDAALLSLPRLLRTRLETIPAQVPYLRVPPPAARRWQERLRAMPGLKVGVVWAGNPDHANDFRRSIAFRLLAPILAVPGVSFVSLQAGPRAADLKPARQKTSRRAPAAIEDLAPALQDFDDSAGAVAALDLVITVDTSIAHLAGGLGKPVWVLLPWVTDWRWMLAREDNPWYPTMRLFRQQRGEDWTPVIAAVARELQAVVAGDVSRLKPFEAAGNRQAARAAEIIAAETASAAAQLPAASQASHPGQALLLAEQKRRHGFIGDADELVRGVAAADPGNAEAAHMLGILAHQSGKAAEAIAQVRRAITLDPNVALYHANLAEMCRLAGRVDEAVAAGRQALAIDPDHASALSNLGIALFEQGRFEEALAYYDRAIARQPDFAQAHSNRGNALQRLKRFAEAEPSYRRAIDLLPGFVEGLNNLGTCLRELKRSEEAEAVYREALNLAPQNPESLDNLALAVQDLGRLDEAADLLARALVIEPRSAKIHLHYGSLLLELKKPEQAATVAAHALSLSPGDHDVVNLTGRVALERGDIANALLQFQRALAIKPDFADAYNNMGNALNELGRLREAEQAFLEALRLEPGNVGVYANLADSRKFRPDDPHLAAMETLAARDLSRNERMQLDFVLGKAYADTKDYPRSFAHLLSGNARKRAIVGYDEAATFALFDRIEAVFTPALIAAKAAAGEPAATPIFVMGMPRSGTTLVEQIIASHPVVHGAGELHAFNEAVNEQRAADGSTMPFPDGVAALDGGDLRQIGARYVAALRALAARDKAASPERITDKMPSNYYFAGLIHLALPNAIIIHCVRDPVDTCVSCFSKLFSGEQSHTYHLAELGRYYRRYQQLMAHWSQVLPPKRILDVRYEDVVADLDGQARRLIAHCGLPWDDACLSFHKTERPVRTASVTQVRQPIYTSAIGRWRVYEEQLGPLLDALGIPT